MQSKAIIYSQLINLVCSSFVTHVEEKTISTTLSFDADVAVGSLGMCWFDQLREPLVIVVDFLTFFPGCFVCLDFG